MPVAEQFAAYGKGNGFPFCLNKVDVSGFDAWTTLSGVNKNNPTPSVASIGESLINAMKLFWLLNGWDIRFEEAGLVFTQEDNYSIDFSDAPFAGGSGKQLDWRKENPSPPPDVLLENNVNKTPIERSCLLGASVLVTPPSAVSTLDSVGLNFVRMYNGSTVDEGNFVGYGISSSGGWNLTQSAGDDFVDILSYTDEFNDGATYESLEYVEWQGISFLAHLYSFSTFSTATVNQIGNSVSFVFTAGSLTYTYDFNSLDFYTIS